MDAPPKSPWFPLVLAVMIGAPGFITWIFAYQESPSWGGDWVKISFPVLIVACVFLVLFTSRLHGVVGLVGGVILSGAFLGTLLFILSGAIAERQEWRAQVVRLDALESFCEGQVAPQPDAPAFTLGAPGMLVAFEQSRGFSTRVRGAEFRDWSPYPPRVDATHAVACIEEVVVDLEVCQYEGGRNMRRVRHDRRVRLFALRRGALIAETVLPGSVPDACHAIEEFYGGGDNVKAGAEATDESVAAFLRGYVQRSPIVRTP